MSCRLWNFIFRFNFKNWSLSGIDWGLRITLASIEYLEGIQERGCWADRVFPIIKEGVDEDSMDSTR